jgi:uncharacterized protein YigE (DUF2233 family)
MKYYFRFVLFFYLLLPLIAITQVVDIQKKTTSSQVLLNKLCEEVSKEDNLIDQIDNLKKTLRDLPEVKNDSSTIKKSDSLGSLISILQNEVILVQGVVEKLKKSFDKSSLELHGGYNVVFKGVKYLFYIHNDKEEIINIHHKEIKTKHKFRSLSNVKHYLERDNRTPLMITNAGMYTPSNNPEGLYIEDYKELFPLDLDSSEVFLNFYLFPNGVFYIDSLDNPHVCSRDEYLGLTKDSLFSPRLATQSGPMLKVNGLIHHRLNKGSKSKKIRSGVGVYKGLSVFAITKGYSNFYDFASFFTEIFECEDALFLDGAISKMYINKISKNNIGGNFGAIISISKK